MTSAELDDLDAEPRYIVKKLFPRDRLVPQGQNQKDAKRALRRIWQSPLHPARHA